MDIDVVPFEDETESEKHAREDLEAEFEEISRETVDLVIDKLILLCNELTKSESDPDGRPLRGYQEPFARRIFESLLIGDVNTITALFARQSGKSETVANVIGTAMIFFPPLAKVFPALMGKYRRGFWVGCFGPTDDQAEIVYSRIVSLITSQKALELLGESDIDAKVVKGFGNSMLIKGKSGWESLVRRQTAHPRSNIEGKTYHLCLVDEAQAADGRVINKSIVPMLSSTNGSMILIGTPTYQKSVFYDRIQQNKRAATKRGAKQNHFEADWREVAKWSKEYGLFVKRQMLEMGEDSDEFRLSYRLHWLLEKGMFTTSERLEALGDKSMEVQHAWHRSEVVVGIDPARKQDSTIVTVVWVDWDRPDEFGFYDHRVLNWLDLSGVSDWEVQYARIVDFLSNYRIFAIGVDEGGLGDPVISRLRHLMPYTKIIPMQSDRKTQSKRWKNLKELIERGRISWPAHAKTTRGKTYQRFIQQMGDLEIKFEGPYVMAQAPRANDAHDDYADSLALACMISGEYQVPEVEVSGNVFFGRR